MPRLLAGCDSTAQPGRVSSVNCTARILCKLLAATLLLLFAANTYGCAISAVYQMTAEPNKYAQQYSTIFLGSVSTIKRQSNTLELVELNVLKVLKGNAGETIRVINHVTSNCSSYFGGPGSRYYVFGNANNAGDEIELNGFPSFVPERAAIETGMLEKLTLTNP